jgi:opacity protein-like surface antigen
MVMNTKTMTAIVAAMGVAIAAAGATARAEAPPPDVHKLIDQMAGTWSVKGAAIQVQGKTMKSDSTAVCDKAAGGWALRCKVTVTTGDRRDELVQVLSWDRSTRAFNFYSASNSGDSHNHVGSFDGKTLNLKYEGSRDGKPFVENLAFTLRGPRELGWKDICTVAGEVVFSGEAIYRK